MSSCKKCQELLGKYATTYQFNCHDCWDIITLKVKNLEAENLKLKECVEFYADRRSYSVDYEANSHGMFSHWILYGDSEELNDSVRFAGKLARQTLAEIKGE